MDAIVVERNQILALNRVPETHLVRDSMVEPRQDTLPVHALWCRSQPEQDARLEGTDHLSIAFGRDMVCLVEYGIVPVRGTLGLRGYRARDDGHPTVDGTSIS
jgi:hypothetical protein